MMVVHLLLARQVARRAVHLELRHARDQGRAHPRRRRRLDHGVRQPRLFDADLARSGPAAVARHDRERRHAGAAGARTSRSPPACSTSRRSTSRGAFQIAVQTLGRLADPEEFANIVVKQTAERGGAAQGRRAASSLPAQDYSSNSYLDRRSGGRARGVPAARLERARDRRRASATTMAELSKRFPPGIEYAIVYDPTQFIQQSVDAVHRDDPRGDPAGRAGGRRCSCRPGAPPSFRSSPSRSR